MAGHWRRHIYRAAKATSFVLVVKGAVAGSVTLLAVAGVTVPYLSELLGMGPATVDAGWAATLGAVVGALAAVRA